MISQQIKHATINFIATNPQGQETRYCLPQYEGVFIGRSRNCGFRLPDESIADIHCRVEYEAGQLWIQDWMSNGGTRVNGESIWTKVEIHEQDVIQIGHHTIRFTSPEPVKPKVANVTSPATVQPALISNESLFDFADDLLGRSEEPAYESDDAPEMIAALQAEIEQLRTELADRDIDQRIDNALDSADPSAEATDEVLQRMRELVDEANRSDERVAILEEMLQAAEDANRYEQEERQHLEAWVSDIENRISQREDEHLAEIELIRKRLDDTVAQKSQLQRQLQQAAANGNPSEHYQQSLQELQQTNQDLQDQLAEIQKQNLMLQQRAEQSGENQEQLLRQERASIAKEQAKVSRLRYELTAKLTAIDELPKSENQIDQETAHRIQTLRQHLREIHEQEKQEERDAPLTKRLAKLWKRIEA